MNFCILNTYIVEKESFIFSFLNMKSSLADRKELIIIRTEKLTAIVTAIVTAVQQNYIHT